MIVRDVLIIGAGPAGLAAAIAATKSGPDLPGHRERRARQLAAALPDRDGVLHHAGADGDRRAAVHQPERQAVADGSAALLPPRDRYLQARRRVRRNGRAHRAGGWRPDPDGSFAVDTQSARGGPARVHATHRRDGHRRLRLPEPHRRARRGSAARLALLHAAAPVLPQARRHRRRQELRRRGGARALSGRRAR